MSKSYDNVIPLFAPRERLRKLVFSIVTDSRAPGEPKETEGSAVLELYRAFASSDETARMREAFAAGIAWSEAKEQLFERIDGEVAPLRARYEARVAAPAARGPQPRDGPPRPRRRRSSSTARPTGASTSSWWMPTGSCCRAPATSPRAMRAGWSPGSRARPGPGCAWSRASACTWAMSWWASWARLWNWRSWPGRWRGSPERGHEPAGRTQPRPDPVRAVVPDPGGAVLDLSAPAAGPALARVA